MIRITKLLFTIVLVFFLTSVGAQASIFGGSVPGDDPNAVGFCLSYPSDPSCHDHDEYDYAFCYGDSLHPENRDEERCWTICADPDYKNDPRCLSEAQIGTGLAETSLSGTGVTHTRNFGDLVIKYVNFLLPYLTLAAFVGFVVAGFFYVTAYGNEEQLQKAKKILIWAVVGLILVIMSYAIVQFLTQDLIEQLQDVDTVVPLD